MTLRWASTLDAPRTYLLAMLIKAYYDGSGKSDANSGCRFLTLAGYAGTQDAWLFFEERWTRVLARWSARGDVAPIGCLHMADAHHLYQDFAPERGWDEAKVRQLVRDLFNEALSPTCWEFRRTFAGASCTVNLGDFRKARDDRPSLPDKYKDPESICVSVVLDRALGLFIPPGTRSHLPADAEVELVFDQNESFRKTIQRVHDVRKREPVFRNIVNISAANSRRATPLQAADMVAWDAHVAYVHNNPVAWFKLRMPFVRRVVHDYYDEPRIGKMFDAAMRAEDAVRGEEEDG